jgi:hypothetical protein
MLESNSWFFLWFLCISSNISAIYILFSSYSWKFLLHPTLYFLIAWMISLFSFFLGVLGGLEFMLLKNIQYLNELFIFVVTANISIILFSLYKRNVIFNNIIHYNWYTKISFFKFYSYVILIYGFYYFISNGFDFADNRFRSTELNREFAANKSRATILDSVFKIFESLRIPLLFYSGVLISQVAIYREIKFKIYFVFIIIGYILITLSDGGRSGIVYVISFPIVAFLIYLFSLNINHYRIIKKYFKYFSIFIFLFLFYINFISSSRSTYSNRISTTQQVFSQYFLGEQLYGLFEYSIFHIWGYQLRRGDTVSEELEYGQYTFQFITTVNIPILSQILGIDFNLANLFNLKTIRTTERANSNADMDYEGRFTTASVFLILFDDFGFIGTIVSIVLFTFFTQYIFASLFFSNINTFFNLILYLFIFTLWRDSWMSHHLNGTMLNAYVYSGIIIHFINKIRF